jgi:hypothetical protein
VAADGVWDTMAMGLFEMRGSNNCAVSERCRLSGFQLAHLLSMACIRPRACLASLQP